MKRPIRACIFDMDGVIVDTAESHFESWRLLTQTWGFTFEKKANEPLKGASRMASLEIILGLAGLEKTEEEKHDLCKIKNEIYLGLIAGLSPEDALPGVVTLLHQLKAAGIKIGLGSASRNAKSILKLIQLDHFFDARVDGNDVTKGKPDPQVFLLGAERLGVMPEQCLVIEDAGKGIDAAKSANMMVLGVGSEDSLGHADLVLPSLEGVHWQEITKFFDLQ